MTILLPRRVIEDQRRERAAEMMAATVRQAVCDDFNRDLKQVDQYLELRQALPHTTYPGVKPGYFHVLRHNPGAPMEVMFVWENPDGSFREPDSGIFEKLAKMDAWSDRSQRERRRREEEADRAWRSRRGKEQEDRVEEVWTRFKSSITPSVSMSGRWSNSVAGKRGRS